MTQRAEIFLSRYSWPGNIRELENTLSYACMMVRGNSVDIRDFPEHLRAQMQFWTEAEQESREIMLLHEIERRYVLEVLERAGGNRARAAQLLGIGRATLYRILSKEPPRAMAAGGEIDRSRITG